MASSRAVSSSPAADLANHFDFQAASNDANLGALAVLKRSTPTALALTLKMRSTQLHVTLQPTLTPPTRFLRSDVGVWSCNCSPGNAEAFAEYMLNKEHRSDSGFLKVPGFDEGSVSGYFDYKTLSVPHNPTLQSIRTVTTSTKEKAKQLVRSIPCLQRVLFDVLLCLGADPKDWEKHLVAFHGLIYSKDRQVEFAWHEDIKETTGLTRECLTAVVQCSDAITGMRVYGFTPFLYEGVGHTSVFPGHCIHQTLPLSETALSALSKPVVKAVFFLEPCKTKSRSSLMPPALMPPPSPPQQPLVQYVLWNPMSTDFGLWFSDLEALIRDRNDHEHAVLQKSVDATHSFLRESPLKSLMHSAECARDGKAMGGDYGQIEYFFRRESSFLTGVVWHSWHPGTQVVNVYCYLVRSGMKKGSGTALHEAFLRQMREAHPTLLSLCCPMKACRLTAGAWLTRLGYQNDVLSSAQGPRGGDQLVLMIREDPAAGRGTRDSKRPRSAPALPSPPPGAPPPAHPPAPPPAPPLPPFGTTLTGDCIGDAFASRLSYTLAASHAEAKELLAVWREYEKEQPTVDLRRDFVPDCGGSKALDDDSNPQVLVWLRASSDAYRIGFAGATIRTGRTRRIATLQRILIERSWRKSKLPSRHQPVPSKALLGQFLLEASKKDCTAMELGAGLSQSKLHRTFFESLGCFAVDMVTGHLSGVIDIHELLTILGGPSSLPLGIGWVCNTCSLDNPDGADQCDACETMRRDEDPSVPLIEWACGRCTLLQNPRVLKCSICGTKRE